MSRPLVLAAHGSRDPRSAQAIRGLAARVARRWAGPVTVGFLDFDAPSLTDAVRAAGAAAVVVPALLTHAYHGRVDVPAAVAAAGLPVAIAPVLGPDPMLIRALTLRVRAFGRVDAVALLAAGSRDSVGQQGVHLAAVALAEAIGVPCEVGFASAGPPDPQHAVTALRHRLGSAARIVGASYFLAPGRLLNHAIDSAGLPLVTAPLAAPAAADLVRLVLLRAAQADQRQAAAARAA